MARLAEGFVNVFVFLPVEFCLTPWVIGDESQGVQTVKTQVPFVGSGTLAEELDGEAYEVGTVLAGGLIDAVAVVGEPPAFAEEGCLIVAYGQIVGDFRTCGCVGQ